MVDKRLEELYLIIEQMKKSADSGDFSTINQLNKGYEHYINKNFSKPEKQVPSEYDLTRNSFVLINSPMFASQKEKMNRDAQERFAKIKNPKHKI